MGVNICDECIELDSTRPEGGLEGYIMDPEEIRRYVFDRLLIDGGTTTIRPLQVRGIVIHHGRKSHQVVYDELKKPELSSFRTPKTIEPLIFYDGIIHIPNPRGSKRLQRARTLAQFFGMILDHFPEYRGNQYEGYALSFPKNTKGTRTAFAAIEKFDDFAYDVVKAAQTEGFENVKRRISVEDVSDIHDILCGPMHLINKHTKDDPDVIHLYSRHDEYLNMGLYLIGKKPVVIFDYMFGDQAFDVIEKYIEALDAMMLDGKLSKPAHLHLYHFGKIGLLSGNADHGTIFVPNGFITKDGRRHVHTPFDNNMFPRTHEMVLGASYSSMSVLRQTREELECAVAAGASAVDMEWPDFYQATQRRFMTNALEGIELYLAGFTSDIPLQGKKISDEPDQNLISREIVKKTIELIKTNHI